MHIKFGMSLRLAGLTIMSSLPIKDIGLLDFGGAS